MRIGELEQKSGASRHTLRYYESIGLLSVQRQGNNYREYSPRSLSDLAFIQQAQGMGFALGEIREMLQAQREQQLDCAQGALLVGKKLAQIEAKITSLQALRKFLRSEKARLELSAAQRLRQAAPADALP
ncbi:MAG: MerR family transcriptional regulator [Pseudomonas sp.]|uniref:MerR family transcriptional regulator n=1 Tax=Pseudomonas sp. TaxID=306 RepID=UPI0027342B04|nr:MerR family transcriptional regulator [Pseudomonas sp.]MDP3848251.1 MerR family transcriptional regulator [Pseudomonas sp.]